jgi:hypothetical protein
MNPSDPRTLPPRKKAVTGIGLDSHQRRPAP